MYGVLSTLICALCAVHGLGLEPLALLAHPQPVWQAAEPIEVNVDFDVPVYGAVDAASKLQKTSSVANSLVERESKLAKAAAAQSLAGNRAAKFLSQMGHGKAVAEGVAVAEQISALLDAVRGAEGAPVAKGEPGMDKEKESASRDLLVDAQKSFNAASSSGNVEENDVEESIAGAMASTPAKLGKPEYEFTSEPGKCPLDYESCPTGWSSRGVICSADGAAYHGPCEHELDLAGLSIAAKKALAAYCAVTFPCRKA